MDIYWNADEYAGTHRRAHKHCVYMNVYEFISMHRNTGIQDDIGIHLSTFEYI